MHFFRKRRRNGLASAVQNLVTELSLVGFISLLLVVLQEPISKICVAYDPGSYTTWSLIANVPGCDCCLADTKSVAACFAVDRGCGPDYCNCACCVSGLLGPVRGCLGCRLGMGGSMRCVAAGPACLPARPDCG